MKTAFVLMTAMPPTVGHLHLIEFANQLAPATRVILTTQPSEPFTGERFDALKIATQHMDRVKVDWIHRPLPQDPNSPGFWELWDKLMLQHGFQPGDLVVSSEAYGQTLADRLDGLFMPYDPNRELYYTKATNIREHLTEYFHDILPEFQRNLRQTITFFGAESTGKSTLSERASREFNGHWVFEYARPYLELVGKEITIPKMKAIWKGQAAIQRHTETWMNKPYVFQDTDLYSTVGYWAQPHWAKDLGPVPSYLKYDAKKLKSDLYIITPSNIPFEQDEIRYGIDKRESPDEYWIDLAKEYGLNYVVLTTNTVEERLEEVKKVLDDQFRGVADSMFYDRGGF